MKSKTLFTSALALVMACSTMLLATSCGDGKDSETGSNQSSEAQITVTYYDGSSELKTEKVAKGGKAVEWTPEKTGYEFKGWYAEASLTTAFKFDTALNEDTDIFARFQQSTYTPDTAVYYAVGMGSGDMKVSNWDQTTAKEGLTFTKDETVTNKNVFTLTILLYAGDQFQVCHGGAWEGQMGIGAMAGAAQNEEAEPEDADYYVVKDTAGETVFCGTKGFGEDPRGWNIVLAEGKDGKYTFTLTTYPDQPSFNEITWKLEEAVEPLTETHKMYFVGTIGTDPEIWSDAPGAATYLTQSEDKSYWSGFVTITSANYASWATNGDGETCAALKLKNEISGSDYGVDGGTENILLTEGTYCFKYTVADNKVEYQKLDYYIVGTFLDGETTVNFAVKENVTPKLTAGTGTTYTGELTATDVTGNGSYSWMTEQGKPGVFAIKVVFGCELGIKTWYAAEGGDNFYLAAGDYTVSVDTATEAVTITPKTAA